MSKELTITVVKAEEALGELTRRLRAVASMAPALQEERNGYSIGFVDGLLAGIKDFLNRAKDEPT